MSGLLFFFSVCLFSYLLLHGSITINVVAQNNTHLLLHSLYRSAVGYSLAAFFVSDSPDCSEDAARTALSSEAQGDGSVSEFTWWLAGSI